MAGLNHAGERGNMISQYKNVAFYGNYDADYVYAIDLNNMSLITTIATEIGPYPVDVLTRKRSFAITRKIRGLATGCLRGRPFVVPAAAGTFDFPRIVDAPFSG